MQRWDRISFTIALLRHRLWRGPEFRRGERIDGGKSVHRSGLSKRSTVRQGHGRREGRRRAVSSGSGRGSRGSYRSGRAVEWGGCVATRLQSWAVLLTLAVSTDKLAAG